MFLKPLPRGLQQGRVHDIPKHFFPVVYYHCLWESFPNIVAKFPPLQFRPIFVLSLVLMSKQFSSSLLIWKLLPYMPSAFPSLDQTSQISPTSVLPPAPWRVKAPLLLYLVDLWRHSDSLSNCDSVDPTFRFEPKPESKLLFCSFWHQICYKLKLFYTEILAN